MMENKRIFFSKYTHILEINCSGSRLGLTSSQSLVQSLTTCELGTMQGSVSRFMRWSVRLAVSHVPLAAWARRHPASSLLSLNILSVFHVYASQQHKNDIGLCLRGAFIRVFFLFYQYLISHP